MKKAIFAVLLVFAASSQVFAEPPVIITLPRTPEEIDMQREYDEAVKRGVKAYYCDIALLQRRFGIDELYQIFNLKMFYNTKLYDVIQKQNYKTLLPQYKRDVDYDMFHPNGQKYLELVAKAFREAGIPDGAKLVEETNEDSLIYPKGSLKAVYIALNKNDRFTTYATLNYEQETPYLQVTYYYKQTAGMSPGYVQLLNNMQRAPVRIGMLDKHGHFAPPLMDLTPFRIYVSVEPNLMVNLYGKNTQVGDTPAVKSCRAQFPDRY